MRLAVLPARGGSKRIPRKNIRAFCGKPMIVWSIEAALESGCFDHVVVSTDDDEIARVAEAHGAEAPFRRPAHLADDNTTTRPVIEHAIHAFAKHHRQPEKICCIYPTAPFIRPDDLRRGLNRLDEGGCSYVFPITSYAFPIQRAVRRNPEGYVEMFQPEHFLTRSQDLEEAWHDAGQFYWAERKTWLSPDITFFGPDAVGIALPRYRVQDIDTEEDWQQAELLFPAVALTHTYED